MFSLKGPNRSIASRKERKDLTKEIAKTRSSSQKLKVTFLSEKKGGKFLQLPRVAICNRCWHFTYRKGQARKNLFSGVARGTVAARLWASEGEERWQHDWSN